MKKFLQSLTIRNGIISLIGSLLAVLGLATSASEIHGLKDAVLAIWPALVGIVTSAGIIINRVRAYDFDKSLLSSKTFWSGIATVVVSIGTVLKLDLSELANITQHLEVVVPAVIMLWGSVKSIYHRSRANKVIGIVLG